MLRNFFASGEKGVDKRLLLGYNNKALRRVHQTYWRIV